jgi:ABC-type ATPase involved in cell division
LISFEQVDILEDEKLILNDISFKIDRDEFVIIYSNQVRVLTVLRDLISFNNYPDQGVIRKKIIKSEIGLVYKNNILLNDRNLIDNFRFILQVKELSQSIFKHRIQRVLKLVDLTFAQNINPSDLLAHQLVRANIAQALLVYPSLLVIDDPLDKLDEVNKKGIIQLLEEINNLGITIILLTNNQEFVRKKTSKKIIKLKKGEVLAEKI